jgi:ribosomal protein L14E/L6E/L27E
MAGLSSANGQLGMREHRLGDEIDDFCVKCKRLTNHAIVSLVDAQAAKVRCRTCYHDHDFRNCVPMPSKKDLKKQALFDAVLAGTASAEDVAAHEASEARDAARELAREAAKKTAAAKKAKSSLAKSSVSK